MSFFFALQNFLRICFHHSASVKHRDRNASKLKSSRKIRHDRIASRCSNECSLETPFIHDLQRSVIMWSVPFVRFYYRLVCGNLRRENTTDWPLLKSVTLRNSLPYLNSKTSALRVATFGSLLKTLLVKL